MSNKTETWYVDIQSCRNRMRTAIDQLMYVSRALETCGNTALSERLYALADNLEADLQGIDSAITSKISGDYEASWKETGNVLRTLIDVLPKEKV